MKKAAAAAQKQQRIADTAKFDAEAQARAMAQTQQAHDYLYQNYSVFREYLPLAMGIHRALIELLRP